MTTEEPSSRWSGGAPGTWGILVHGGAGDTPSGQAEGRMEGCKQAVEAGQRILAAGGHSLDAVQAAVEVLEDNPLFNAGTGGALDEDGELRLDASIMDGVSLAFGAVGALPPFRHPIAIAREVLRDGRHALYVAEGAARFARSLGFSEVEPASMITELAQRALLTKKQALLWPKEGEAEVTRASSRAPSTPPSPGTVGAVARDLQGHVAAATSTGGLTHKRAGRIGDTPVPGAGTYADDAQGAASSTGDGEAFLRSCAALRAVLLLAHSPPDEAATEVLLSWVRRLGASGGMILVRQDGLLGWARTTRDMSWAASWQGEGLLHAGI